LTGIEDIDQISYNYNFSEISKLFEGEDETLKLWFIFYLDTEDILDAYEEYLSVVDYISNVDLVGIYEVGLEPNDPLFNNMDHKAFYDSKIPEAWDIETGNSNILVGIIDLGIGVESPRYFNR
jgi:hypothetical protein